MKIAILAVIALACPALVISTPATAQHMNDLEGPCRGSASTVDLTACLGEAFRDAQSELDSVYARTLEYTDSVTQNRLRQSQRAWIAYRKHACEADAAPYLRATGEGPARLACLEAITAERTQFLVRSLGWRVEKFASEAEGRNP